MSEQKIFSYHIEEIGREIEIAWVRIDGSLTVSNKERLMNTLDEIKNKEYRNVVLDLGEVEYLDSSIVSILISKYKEITKAGGMMRVCNPTMRIIRIFRFLGFDQAMKVYHDSELAKQSFLYQEETVEKIWKKYDS